MTETSQPDVETETTTFPQLVSLINEALLERKAEQLVVLDVSEITTLADYFIICSGGSDTHIKALADNVSESIKESTGEHVWRREGLESKKWVVLDYVNVVVHVFNHETRSYYALENMWSDAKITSIED
ncbi:ribosome silencing factor [Balneolales bacterium ANBcel1]|nr:ribosome silencing factor [Balneolales bacterium ANBcel1]